MNKNKPTEAQLEALTNLGIAAPTTRKGCAMILDWIRHGGSESGKRIAILKDGQSWVGKKVQEKDGPTTGTVLFVLPKTPEALLQHRRALDAKHAFQHPLDARIKCDNGKLAIISVGRIGAVPQISATTVTTGQNTKGTLTATLRYAGRSQPIPEDDPNQ